MNASAPSRQRHDVVSWAHYLLAVSRRLERRALHAKGVRTIVLVDSDIFIGQTDTGHQRRMFHDLLEPQVGPRFLDSLSGFVYAWLVGNFTQREGEAGVTWAVSPDHFREVVNKAEEWLDELAGARSQPASSNVDVAPEAVQRLVQVLQAMEADPWCDVDDDLMDLLGMLGVGRGNPSTWDRVAAVRDWLQILGNAGCIVQGRGPGSGALAGLEWPGLQTAKEVEIFRAWREHLWRARHAGATPDDQKKGRPARFSSRTIDADARVLTALTRLNEHWQDKKLRVELFTGSSYVLRAVAARGLDPLTEERELNAEQADRMSDFVIMPTAIVAENSLWEPTQAERQADIGNIFEWSAPETAVPLLRRRRLFSLIHASGESAARNADGEAQARAAELLGEAREEALPQGATGSFRSFFSSKVSRSMALAHVHERLENLLRTQASTLLGKLSGHTSPEELMARLDELAEFRRVQIRIDMLEYLIQAHLLNHPHGGLLGTGPGSTTANPMRRAPFVDYGSFEPARRLSDALAADPAGDAHEAVAQLKREVYALDPTTYLLVLVHAHVYARQSRWRLAFSAADYAYRLSQTPEYDERRRKVLLGDEAWLLRLACMRRAAATPEDVSKALQDLNPLLSRMPDIERQEPLTRLRTEVEHNSLVLTDLFMQFFAAGGLRDDRAFRARAGEELQVVARLADDAAQHRVQSPPTTPAELALWRDVDGRIAANGCNLGWLCVGWLPTVLEKSKGGLQPRRHLLTARYPAHVIDFVDASLAQMTAWLPADAADWATWYPRHVPLTVLATCLVLGKPLPGTAAGGSPALTLAQMLADWRGHQYEHPYDKQRVVYAADLLRCLGG